LLTSIFLFPPVGIAEEDDVVEGEAPRVTTEEKDEIDDDFDTVDFDNVGFHGGFDADIELQRMEGLADVPLGAINEDGKSFDDVDLTTTTPAEDFKPRLVGSRKILL
jgi:hypothetical protein